GNRGDVSANHLFCLGDTCSAVDEQIGVTRANRGARKSMRYGGPRSEIRSQGDVVHIIHIEEVFCGGWWAVRLEKSASNEERLVFVRAQVFDGAVRNAIIAIALAVPIQNNDAIGIRGTAEIVLRRWDSIRGLRRSRRRRKDQIFSPCSATRRLDFGGRAIGVGPSFWIIAAGVKDFPAAQANIAVFPEALRQCDPIGMNASEGDAIAEHPGFCRWPTRKQRRARWIAKRKLAVISVKTNTGFGECVEVRRLGVKHTAVTAELHAHVVTHD